MTHILITNDDGIHAKGLRALVHALEGLGTISVVAPCREHSGAAQSLTLRQPVFYKQIADREWAVEGTPADSMILALHKLLTTPPDLVISGINPGGNMGENVFYSGTVGAAMEGTINHIPALAISVAYKAAATVQRLRARRKSFARELAQLVLKEGMPRGVLLNVNVPLTWNGSVRISSQSKKVTRNVLEGGIDSNNRNFYWLREQQHVEELDPQSDYAASLLDGAISMTPLQLDRTHGVSLKHISHWATQLEAKKTSVEK